MGTSNILFFLLILNTVLAQTNKTCSGGDWACGDQCISYKDDCLCGDRRIGIGDPRWCCNSGLCEGKRWSDKYGRTKSNASCPGTVQSLDTPCHGSCSKATQAGYGGITRSRLLCDHDKCVEDHYMCSGRKLCEDETDLRLCGDENIRNNTCPNSWGWRCNNRFPGQCVEERVKSTGDSQG